MQSPTAKRPMRISSRIARWNTAALDALLQRLESGYAGPPVFRGIGGFGARSVSTHDSLSAFEDLPLCHRVDRAENARSSFRFDEMVPEASDDREVPFEILAGKRPLDGPRSETSQAMVARPRTKRRRVAARK